MIPDFTTDELRALGTGDPGVFRTFVERLSRYTFNLAFRMTGSSGDAEDLAQEIFLRLHQNRTKLDPTRPFGPWFRTLAVNSCLNGLRRKRPMRSLQEQPAPQTLPETDERAQRLRQAILELPVDQRMAITLYYLEEISVGDIAQALGNPAGTIKTWLFRARERLRSRLTLEVFE